MKCGRSDDVDGKRLGVYLLRCANREDGGYRASWARNPSRRAVFLASRLGFLPACRCGLGVPHPVFGEDRPIRTSLSQLAVMLSVHFIPNASREAVNHAISFAVAFSFITSLHIIVGELATESFALQRAEQTAVLAAGPIRLLYLAFRPAIVLLNSVGNAVARMIGIEPASGHQCVRPAEELRTAVDTSRDAGLVEDPAHNLVDRALLFPELEAQHAMAPRMEIAAVPNNAGLDHVIQSAMNEHVLRVKDFEGLRVGRIRVLPSTRGSVVVEALTGFAT